MTTMSKLQSFLLRWFLLFSLTHLFGPSRGDVGTASQYSPPYLPTACYGSNVGKLPTDNFFASASEGIWNNEASCGRQYLVRCLSAITPGTCTGRTIQLKIVDRSSTSVSRPSYEGTTMALSESAFAAIANISATEINIEFQQV
ncbi:hypothetical protein GIB67_043141 [Kingdonia uniflora]|uniref:Expansin-like EG45 domain-containing protein n=1 Tax=Kingdonia uniflora TaxID=39325 RepID=A0A7J7NJV8_9MAGN|nr:hypothetical protein GIB67_011677 [Kingdonia uniflora]KAF6167280.1 hypothetical protein GIB67_043141 [Kingdonia uniflora]